MLNDLDKTLEALLKQELPVSLQDQITISFTPPSGGTAASGTNKSVINLFLYDIRENLDLRQNEWSMGRTSDRSSVKAVKQRSPVRVDCSYLITVSSKPDAGEFQEHEILGDVMQVLLRHPTLPPQVLQGSLIGQDPPVRTQVLRAPLLQVGEFWQAMGGTLRAVMNYTVTIAVPVAEEITVPLVTHSQINFNLMQEEK